MSIFFSFAPYFPYAQSIAQALSCESVLITKLFHASGEIELVHVDCDVRNKTICIIQSITNHDELIAVILLAHKLKKQGVLNICLLSPYMMYSRLDKTQEFKAIINMLEASGIDRIITVELHNPTVLAWFSIPVTHIQLDDLLCDYISRVARDKHIYLVSPDMGGAQRVKRLAQRLTLSAIACTKKRSKNGLQIVIPENNLSDTHALFIDDIIDTGKTVVALCDTLYTAGVKSVSGIGVHPVFSKDKKSIITHAKLTALMTTNTIQLSDNCDDQLDITPNIMSVLEHIL